LALHRISPSLTTHTLMIHHTPPCSPQSNKNNQTDKDSKMGANNSTPHSNSHSHKKKNKRTVNDTNVAAGDALSVTAIIKAANFAAIKHLNQRRKDSKSSPYINHTIGRYI
jgi:hypothetical protein